MARPPKKISDFDRKLGETIKYRRQHPDVGVTQAQLAERAGIPLSNLQRREEGTNEVTVSELERIAHVLKTSPASLTADALSRYGGLSKLLAEYATVSEDSPTVDDTLAKKRAQKESILSGGQWDEGRERSAANVDPENLQPEPESP